MSNSTKRPVNVAALGYYGFQNLGDEAVLAGIRHSLETKCPAQFTVLTNDAQATARLHPGVMTVNRWKWREVATALRGTDLFVFGGGSLLQDATSVQSVLWYGLMALLARKRARRVVWWAQGIGPLNSPVSRHLVRLIANQADLLTVRDPKSEELLKQIGVRGSIHVAADPAFALSPASVAPVAHAAPLLALRHWKTDGIGEKIGAGGQRAFADALAQRAQSRNGVQAVPMHLPDDRDYTKQILGDAVSLYDWAAQGSTVEQVLGRFAQAPIVVAMRLHALIFAARCGVPFVALSYDPKVDEIARASGQEDALLPVNNISVDVLLEKVASVTATRKARQEHLNAFAQERHTLAQTPATFAADLL